MLACYNEHVFLVARFPIFVDMVIQYSYTLIVYDFFGLLGCTT